MTKVHKKNKKYNKLLISQLEGIDTIAAKALLPFFKKYTPAEAFKALTKGCRFYDDGCEEIYWFHGFYLTNAFLSIHSYHNNTGLVDNKVEDLPTLLLHVFSEWNDFYLYRTVKFMISNGEDNLNMEDKELLFSLLATIAYYQQFRYKIYLSKEEIFTGII